MGGYRIGFVVLASLAAFTLALVVPAASLGYRFEIFGLFEAFDALALGYKTALGGLALGGAAFLVGLLPRPRGVIMLAVIALAANGASAYTVWKMRDNGQKYPRIHDISTDLENPPQFVAVAELREEGDHPTAYAGEYDTRCGSEENDCDPAALQRQAYPDIEPIVLYVDLNEAYHMALDAANAMGWEIVDASREEGRIEATDTTMWFGFKDDIVIRLTTEAQNRTRVDVRSQSRVGQSDLGKNAMRVRAYLAELGSRA